MPAVVWLWRLLCYCPAANSCGHQVTKDCSGCAAVHPDQMPVCKTSMPVSKLQTVRETTSNALEEHCVFGLLSLL